MAEPHVESPLTRLITDWLRGRLAESDMDDQDDLLGAAAKGGPALHAHFQANFASLYEEAVESVDNANGMFLARFLMDRLKGLVAWDAVARAIEPCIQVEYHLGYSGGDFDLVGSFAYIPRRLVRSGKVGRAFKAFTGHDPIHIIHFTSDEVFLPDGTPVEA